MNGPGDVVDGVGLVNQRAGLGVVEVDGARIAELGQALLVGVGVLKEVGIGDGHGDHLAAFFGVSDGDDLYARAGSRKQPEVFVDVFGVGQHIGRAGDIAQGLCGRGNGLRSGQVVHQRRQERRVGCVLVDVVGVFLIDGLLRVTGEAGVEGLRVK